MIRNYRLLMGVEAFAAERRPILDRTESRLRRSVELGLVRVGLPGWFAGIVDDALDVFDETVLMEAEEGSQVIDDLRDAFRLDLERSLALTKRTDNVGPQVDRITRSVAVAAINAAVEAAVAADPDPAVGIQWVTMLDEDVRNSHREMHGSVTAVGGTFEIEGFEVAYPGQPVGPPELWINCRCMAAPTRLDALAARTETAGAQMTEQFAIPVAEEEPAIAPEEVVPEEVEPPEITEDMWEPVPWHGVLAPEGVPSGDGRMFSPGALRNRELPLPLKWMPADAEGHDGSVVVGRIDNIWRDGNELRAQGVFDHSAYGYEAVRLLAEGMIRGVSVDVDDATAAASEDSTSLEFSSARIAAATLCAIPAFSEAFVALGPWDEGPVGPGEPEVPAEEVEAPEGVSREEQIEILNKDLEGMGATVASQTEFDSPPRKTKDGPGWITEPRPTHRITAYWVDGPGAAKIGWGAGGDFNRCRLQLVKYVQNPDWLAGLCANLHYRALGIWPGQHAGRTEAMSTSNESLTASVALVPQETEKLPSDWFRNPELSSPTPFTVTDDWRVFGHVATWDVCHIGIGDVCTTAPHSVTDYAYFKTGAVETDAGLVAVGQISLGGGHASLNAGVRPAIAHYDSTSTAVADVTVGEDEFGIWVAGAVRPGTTSEQVHALRAAALSGDWREVVKANGESNLEMVAALAVNVPGFPIPRPSLAASGDRQTALVAASIPQRTQDQPSTDIEKIATALIDAYEERKAKRVKVLAARSVFVAEADAKRQARATKVAAAKAAIDERR